MKEKQNFAEAKAEKTFSKGTPLSFHFTTDLNFFQHQNVVCLGLPHKAIYYTHIFSFDCRCSCHWLTVLCKDLKKHRENILQFTYSRLSVTSLQGSCCSQIPAEAEVRPIWIWEEPNRHNCCSPMKGSPNSESTQRETRGTLLMTTQRGQEGSAAGP